MTKSLKGKKFNLKINPKNNKINIEKRSKIKSPNNCKINTLSNFIKLLMRNQFIEKLNIFKKFLKMLPFIIF